MDKQQLSPVAQAVISVFSVKEPPHHGAKISVNKLISELASWYEKLRNVMEIRDDSVILKNAIERILKRRLLLGGNGEKVAEPLLRELVWERYFQDNTLSQHLIHETAAAINLYQELHHNILSKQKFPENTLTKWMFDIMSCHISYLLRPNKEKEAVSNFMYNVLKNHISISDDTEDTKNVQVYIGVRRAFAKDDRAFLRFHLFQQVFPHLTKDSLDKIATGFTSGYKEIERQLSYPLKEKIYIYIKRQSPVFFILEDVLFSHKENVKGLIEDTDAFSNAIFAACQLKYDGIKTKVRNAIIRSVFFLILTKVVIAFAVEGTYDKLNYGHIMWRPFFINIASPPLLMILVSFFIKTPGVENSRRILSKINSILYEENPKLAPDLTLALSPKKTNSFLTTIFGLLWFLFFLLSFGLMIWFLTKLQFNIISQTVFIFFITIVSFLSYRINIAANAYTVEKGQGLLTPFIDILFLPIIKVGMRLTDGISQINIFIFIFDFLIEAPFKIIFGFIEQLFAYLHTKREDLE
jgi:hypothetical protein